MSQVVRLPLSNGQVGAQAFQLPFLRPENDSSSNSIGIWDLTPWPVLYTPSASRLGGKFLDSITRSFEARGHSYTLTLRPARIKYPDGTEADEFPGEREALVEMAVRKLAAQRQTLEIERNTVSVTIGLYELFNELKATGHSMRYVHIEEALRILNGTQVEIKRTEIDGDGDQVETILSSAIFITMALKKYRRKEDSNSAHIQFNSLITDAIRGLDFHEINYALLMKMRPVPRWVYKRLLHEIMFGSSADRREHVLRASSILESSGMNGYKRLRDAFDKITGFVTELHQQGGVIESFTVEKEEVGSGRERKTSDVLYRIRVTDEFYAQAESAIRGQVHRIEDFEALTQRKPSEGWVTETTALKTGLKKRVSARKKAEQLNLI